MTASTSPEQDSLPLYETADRPELNRYQRIEMIEEVQGFLPTNFIEVTEATGLQSFIGRPGGAAKHLAEVVLGRRNAKTSDPLAAARRITHEYIGFAVDAKQSGAGMSELQEALTDVNPELVVGEVVRPTDPGMLPFFRFFDLSLLRKDGSPDKMAYDPLRVKYVPENGGITYYLGEAISSWRVNQVTRKLPAARSHEAARLDFWLQRIVEVGKHYPKLRPITEEGLDKIHDRNKVQ
jgi:hypothetical protein